MVRGKNASIIFLSILLAMLVVSFIPFEFVPKVKAADPWHLPSYSYRKLHYIHVGSASTPENYLLGFHVYAGSGFDYVEFYGTTYLGKVYVGSACQSDFDDIRFVLNETGTVCQYNKLLYNSGVDALIWIKIPISMNASTTYHLYMYYGFPYEIDESVAPQNFYIEFGGGRTTTGNGGSLINNVDLIPLSGATTIPSGSNYKSVYWMVNVNSAGRTIRFKAFSGSSPSYTCRFRSDTYTISQAGLHIAATILNGSGWEYVHNGSFSVYMGYYSVSGSGAMPLYFSSGSLRYRNGDLNVGQSGTFSSDSNYHTWCSIVGMRVYVDPEPQHGDWEADKPDVYVDSEPSWLGSLGFKWDGVLYNTPKIFENVEYASEHSLQVVASTIILNSSFHIGFSHWLKDGVWFSNDLTISTGSLTQNTNFTMVYENMRFNITADVSGVAVSVSGSTVYAPCYVWRCKGYTSFQVLTLKVPYNDTYSWSYAGVYVNESYYSSSAEFSVYTTGNTSIFLDFELVFQPPYSPPPIVPPAAHETTWYFRSDTHVVNEQLGYRLSETCSSTYAEYSKNVEADLSVSVGFRAWVYGRFGRIEITPSVVGITTITSNGEFEENATWNFAGYNHEIVDAVEIRIYIRFGSGDWIEAVVGITDADLDIQLPESNWIIFYNVEREGNETYTLATIRFGSPDYDTRITLYTGRASPWDVALVRVVDRDFVGWLTTPFTYHLGDLFYAIIVLFCCVTIYNDTESLGYVVAILWLFGGAGSILAALLPAITLNIAYILLAFATALTLLKLIIK